MERGGRPGWKAAGTPAPRRRRFLAPVERLFIIAPLPMTHGHKGKARVNLQLNRSARLRLHDAGELAVLHARFHLAPGLQRSGIADERAGLRVARDGVAAFENLFR